jgi:hypothetical protein
MRDLRTMRSQVVSVPGGQECCRCMYDRAAHERFR